MYEVEKFPAMPWRRKLLLLACALATVTLILSQMMSKPGAGPYKPPAQLASPDPARCAPGQTTECVGGMATVILPATPVAGSAPR
jgi:hypothetical protein